LTTDARVFMVKAGLGLGGPRPSTSAMQGPTMLIGNAPCSWGIAYPTGNSVTWQQYLDQVAEAGYRGTELGPFGFLPKDKAVLSDELGRRGLTLIGITHVHTFGDRRPHRSCWRRSANSARCCATWARGIWSSWTRATGIRPGARACSTRPGGSGLVATVREAQAVIEGEFGLKASFHPHVGTAVEREAQIDRLLAETEIDLCFDTGHHAFWGQDPLAYMKRVWGRIAYMHLKNVDAAVRAKVLDGKLSIEASYGRGVMAPLPDGAVDIRAIMRFLEAAGLRWARGGGAGRGRERQRDAAAAGAPAISSMSRASK
jgi:inosose dehydratase